jgi:MFS transporter, DHA1 family, inner membrane transport protein
MEDNAVRADGSDRPGGPDRAAVGAGPFASSSTAPGTGTATGTGRRLSSPSGWTLAAVCLAPFVTQLATFALSPFLPFVAADLDTSAAVLGQIPALALLTAAVLGLIIGPLADRFGHRPTLLFGVLASSIGAVATACAPSLLVLVPVALIGAGGRSVGLPVAQAVVGTLFTGPAVRRGIGLIQATGTLAPIVGIPLVTALGALAGWRVAFLALGALGLVAAGLMLWLLPPDPPSDGPRSRLSLVTLLPALRDRPTVWMYASTLTRNLGVWSLVTYLGAFLVASHALTTAEVGWVFTATGVGNFLGSLLMSGPLGRVSIWQLALWSPGLIGVCLGLVLMVPASLGVVVGLLTVGFVFNGVGIVAQNTLLMDISPASRATTTSLNQTCMSLGGAVGSSLGGVLLAVGGFPALGVLALVCNVLSAACLLPARR